MKKFFVTLFIILTVSYPVFSSEITDDYIDIAKNYLNAENNKKAQEYVDLVLLLDPNNKKAKSFKAITVPETTDINKDKIVKVEENALKLSVNSQTALLNNRGVGYYNEENINDAIKFFKKAISYNRRNCIPHYNLALCYKQQGKKYLAEYYFRRSYALNKNFTNGLVSLANMKKRNSEKLKLLTIASKSKNAYANYYLGEFYFEKQNYKKALLNYSEALIINPNIAQAYLKAAQCCLELEDYEMEIINLKKYMTYISDNDDAHFMLSKAYCINGYLNNGLHELNKAIKINRKDEYLFELAKICYEEQNYDLSIYIINKIIKNSDNANYYNQLGLNYYEKNDLKNAKDNFEKAIAIDPKSATIYYNISKCDSDNALSYIETAKQIVPSTPQQAIDLAKMYYRISENDNALLTISEAVKKYCNDKEVYKAKMKLCKLIGDYNEYEKTKIELSMKFGVK